MQIQLGGDRDANNDEKTSWAATKEVVSRNVLLATSKCDQNLPRDNSAVSCWALRDPLTHIGAGYILYGIIHARPSRCSLYGAAAQLPIRPCSA